MKIMLNGCAKLLSAFVCALVCAQLAEAQCRKAKAEDVPHGANEFILYRERTVGRVHGSVFLPNYRLKAGRERAKNIVVELYSFRGEVAFEDVSKVLREQKRVAACLTGADGRFSFPELTQGRYLLRVGTREHDQFNETHLILTVDTNRPIGKGLEIVLSAGT